MLPRFATSASYATSTPQRSISLLCHSALPQPYAGETVRLQFPSPAGARASATSKSALLSIHSIGSTSGASSASTSRVAPSSSLRRTFRSSPGPPALLAPEHATEEERELVVLPHKSTEEARAWYDSRFPGLSLPDKILLQAITDRDWRPWGNKDGHWRREAFVGRRAIKMFLAIFFHANLGHLKEFAMILNRVNQAMMHGTGLGDQPGRKLGLEAIMRCYVHVDRSKGVYDKESLFQKRGRAVEALVGAIYHQHGAAIARSFFHANVLSEFDFFHTVSDLMDDDMRSALSRAIMAEAKSGAAVLQALADRASTASLDPTSSNVVEKGRASRPRQSSSGGSDSESKPSISHARLPSAGDLKSESMSGKWPSRENLAVEV